MRYLQQTVFQSFKALMRITLCYSHECKKKFQFTHKKKFFYFKFIQNGLKRILTTTKNHRISIIEPIDIFSSAKFQTKILKTLPCRSPDTDYLRTRRTRRTRNED